MTQNGRKGATEDTEDTEDTETEDTEDTEKDKTKLPFPFSVSSGSSVAPEHLWR